MTYLPIKPTTPTSTVAPASQGLLPGSVQIGDQVLVFRPGSGTYYVNLTDITASVVTNRLTLRDGSLLTLRDGTHLSHR